ncbi:YlxR family protein [Specibacter sp. NPDC057265]|uniref:YlxR family protein n=1 Tax=Specibacter sp. NPDC057265 TaxID=3346075 RepID=UPI00362BA814
MGCRKVGDRSELVRLVRTSTASGDMEVAVDLRRRLPGRGAWLHPDPACWSKALKRRAIGRALPGVTAVAAAESFAANELALVAKPEART